MTDSPRLDSAKRDTAEAEVQRLRDQLVEARAAHRNAEEYASEGWAWVETFCELADVPDVFALREALARSERVTDSPRLEEVFAAVLAEHRLDDHECDCGYLFNTTFTDDEVFALHAAHVAERLAARFAQVGSMDVLGTFYRPENNVPENDTPVFAIIP